MKLNVSYTAVIRTLGVAGDKYQRLLDSLKSQSIPPQDILVYIAKGSPLPEETIGVERYVYVNKGMVAQRALAYDEVNTEYILFLDDDLEFPADTVENMFAILNRHNGDVISPDIYPNSDRPVYSEIMMTISGRMRPRYRDDYWGYKVMETAGYSYNKKPMRDVYPSQTNAGACFLCRKEDFLRIHFEEEIWLDRMSYPIGEDQTMYFKMYCSGMTVLTWYNHKFIHLDAGNNMSYEKELKRLYCDIFFKSVFWHRFLYLPQRSMLKRFRSVFSIVYYLTFAILISLVKFQFGVLSSKVTALRDAYLFVKSNEYKDMPEIVYSYD